MAQLLDYHMIGSHDSATLDYNVYANCYWVKKNNLYCLSNLLPLLEM